MNWKVFALSGVTVLCLSPQFALSQTEGEANPDSSQSAPESTPSTEPSPAADSAAAAPASGKGIFGDLRFGPSVAVGVPHPLTAAVDFVYADLFSVSLGSGRFGVELEDTEIEIRNWDVTARVFPFHGSFFIGAAYGSQGIVGKMKTDIDVESGGVTLKVPTTIRLEIESKYLTPQIGWFARWDSGFTLGFDFGLQMPSGTSSELQTSFENVSAAGEAEVKNSAEYKKNKKDVEDAAEMIGKKAIPYITLIRLGWLF